MIRNTKILATIGPSSANEEVLRKFKDLEVNCLRINSAHGDFKSYEEIVKLVNTHTNIPLLMDVKGPEIRVRTQGTQVKKNCELEFYFKDKEPYFSYDFLTEVEVGDKIFFDNGLIESEIVRKNSSSITLKFYEKGMIKPNKGVNIPKRTLKIPSLSKKDIESVKFSLKHNFTYIALSFVRNKEDIINLKKLLGDKRIGIISKIENWEGIENIDEIIDHSEGIMIARGDLGIEIEEEKIPILQKELIQKCNQKSKIAIVATQMLESMTTNKIPTRAEVSDVANAILDGADAVMLSGETAAGKYPVKSVEVMDKVAREVETKIQNKVNMKVSGNISEELSKSTYHILQRTPASKAITLTRSGYSANVLSRFRLKEPVIAVTNDKTTENMLGLVWGVRPVYLKELPEIAKITRIALELEKKGHIHMDEMVVFFAGVKTLQEKVSNLIEVHYVHELLHFHKQVVSKELTKQP